MDNSTIARIVLDSEFLKILFYQSNDIDIGDIDDMEELDYIENNLSSEFLDTFYNLLGTDKDLIERLYENEYDFNDDELIKLAKKLKSINSKRLEEILIIMKHKDNDSDGYFYNQLLKTNIISDYLDMALYDILYLTFIAYDLPEPLRWVIAMENNFDVNHSIVVAIDQDSVNVFKILLDYISEDEKQKLSKRNYYSPSYKILKYLIEIKADININEAFAHYCRYNLLEEVKLLLNNGSNVHFNDDEALVQASDNGKFELVKILLEHGANVHEGYDYPLRFAVKNGHYDVVKLLLNYGADVHANDNYSYEWASPEIIKLLKEYE